jgi:hypothetical protein
LPALIEQPAQKDLTNNFSGELRLGAGSRYAVELRGFHHYQSIEEPALLRVYLSADKSADNAVDFDFHTVDSWTAFAQKSTAERFIGTDEGEAKLLIGSLRIPATTVLPTAAQHKNLVAAVRALHAEMHGSTRDHQRSGDFFPPDNSRVCRAFFL